MTASGAMPDQNAYITEMLTASLPITIVSLFVGLLYETVFLVWRGATPGKMALGTVVRRVGSPGKLTVVDAIKRQLIGLATAASRRAEPRRAPPSAPVSAGGEHRPRALAEPDDRTVRPRGDGPQGHGVAVLEEGPL